MNEIIWPYFVTNKKNANVLIIEKAPYFNYKIAKSKFVNTYLVDKHKNFFNYKKSCQKVQLKYNFKLNKNSDYQQKFDLIVIEPLNILLEEKKGIIEYYKSINVLARDLFEILTKNGEIYFSISNVSLKKAVIKQQKISLYFLIKKIFAKCNFKVETICSFDSDLGHVFLNKNNFTDVLIKNIIRSIVKGQTLGFHFTKNNYEFCSLSQIELLMNALEKNAKGKRRTGSQKLCKIWSGSGGTIIFISSKYVIKTPNSKHLELIERWYNNYVTLIRLRNLKFSFNVPKPVFIKKILNVIYSVEELLPGITKDNEKFSDIHKRVIYKEIVDISTEILERTGTEYIIDKKIFYELIQKPLSQFKFYVESDYIQKINKIEEYLKKAFLGKKETLVLNHGDFQRSNLKLNNKGNIIGVIDWEMANEIHFPYMDLMLFFSFEDAYETGIHIGKSLVKNFIITNEKKMYNYNKYKEKIRCYNSEKERLIGFICLIKYLLNHQYKIKIMNKKYDSEKYSFLYNAIEYLLFYYQ